MDAGLAAELANVRTEIAGLRADVEAALRSQTWTIVTTMITLTGLVTGIVFTLTRFT